jgi:NADH:ubiquinone oxidoreductase subunit 6 (subunit J)
MLDLNEEARRRFQRFGVATGVISAVALGGLTVFTILRSGIDAGRTPQIEGSTEPLGTMLFTQYCCPL